VRGRSYGYARRGFRLDQGCSDRLTIGFPADAAARRPEPHWYAAYTCARHEKQVARQLQERRIECFLPVYHSVRRWKDRRRHLELALFPGYVFVRIDVWDRLRVLQLPGVVRFVCFNGAPAPLPDHEIESWSNGLAQGIRPEPHPYLKVGRRVLIRCGPLSGMQGILVRKKEKFRVVLSIELIMRSVAVEVDEADIEPCLDRSSADLPSPREVRY
jgi:transcription antitermination factor NusG